jgi:hypothetical protein
VPDLLGIEPEVVGVGEHHLEGQLGFVEASGAGEAFDVPERAHRVRIEANIRRLMRAVSSTGMPKICAMTIA